jgi:choloylglycine hydrolase
MKTLVSSAIPACLLLILALAACLEACTTFVLEDGDDLVFGRNLDWHTGIGLIMVNPRGLSKTALISPPDMPAQWVSEYGSVTFNQVGRGFPYGGINEVGLVIENMMLDETRYPERDGRPAVSECQWIQYHLDNCATVGEVLGSSRAVRIGQAQSPLHFLVCDAFGETASVEFLDGEMVYHTGRAMPVKVLANSTYEESVRFLREREGPVANGSLEHFFGAATMIEEYDPASGGAAVAYAFDILEKVDQGSFTKWSVVYDIGEMKIHYRTNLSPAIRTVDIESFDFFCSTPPWIVDIDIDAEGPIEESFIPYSTAANRDLVFRTFNFFREAGFLTHISDDYLEALARYPETFDCVGAASDPD